MNISSLNLSARIRNAFTREGVTAVEQLVRDYSWNDVYDIRNIGHGSCIEIRDELAAHGFRLRCEEIL